MMSCNNVAFEYNSMNHSIIICDLESTGYKWSFIIFMYVFFISRALHQRTWDQAVVALPTGRVRVGARVVLGARVTRPPTNNTKCSHLVYSLVFTPHLQHSY